jgi:hypothetical protein
LVFTHKLNFYKMYILSGKVKKYNMKKLFLVLSFLIQIVAAEVFGQNIGINATGALPDPSSMLDVSSSNSGLLIPRMTTVQRNAIASPAVGLYIYNTTTNTFNVFNGAAWASLGYENNNVVTVKSLSDLPAPVSGAINLDPTKTYSFSGLVNISPYYINMNGAVVKGTNPIQDGVRSNVSGAILHSVDQIVFIEKLLVVPASGSTKAYDFSDATGTKSCNLITGNNVKEVPGVPSLGVGQISGFRIVVILNNYFIANDGLKITGNMGRILFGFNSVEEIKSGSGLEFLPGLTINDIDISNNYFVYPGQTGVKVNAGANIGYGRMTTNMFRGVGTALSGFDSFTPGWEMLQNSGVANSRAYCYLYNNDNTTATQLTAAGTYYKVAGNTVVTTRQKFSGSTNRLTYLGKRDIIAKIFAVAGGKAHINAADYTIAIAKNGVVIPAPNASLGSLSNNQGFQIVLQSEVEMKTNDYIEIFIKSGSSGSVVITDLQFRVND